MPHLGFRDVAWRWIDPISPAGVSWSDKLSQILSHLLTSKRSAWTVLLLLLGTALPIFVCMPLWGDVTLYDLAARNLLQGGVAYRDVFDTNLPGIVWLHVAIRSSLGWRSEAIRLVDFAIVSGCIGLLIRDLPGIRSRGARVWAAAVLYAYYFSTPEWCHCQRDSWMLLPCLLALGLRRKQLARLPDPATSAWWVGTWAAVEGFTWAAAFWIKPFVIVPALACWLVGASLIGGPRMRSALDAAGVVAGGLAAGGLGVAWLYASGAWPYFWDVMLHWNTEYNHDPLTLWRRLEIFSTWLTPWSLTHWLALPLAVTAVAKAFWSKHLQRPDHTVRALARRQALLGAFYLGWVVQVIALQKWFYYIQAPAVLLALGLVVQWGWTQRRSVMPGLVVLGLLVWAGGRYYLLEWEKRSQWLRCLYEGADGYVWDDLSAMSTRPNATSWKELETVSHFLQRQGVGDGELTCFHNSTLPLYLVLNLRPSTRFLHFQIVLTEFPRHREEVRRELAASPQRYVVSDLWAIGVHEPESLTYRPALPPVFPRHLVRLYPWHYPVVFRTRRYLVHRVQGAVGPIWPESALPNRQ
jgi:hypothetical protein